MNVEQPGPVVPEAAWFKSSYSTGSGGECVEVAACSGCVHVRDSKDKAGPTLSISSHKWTAFIHFTSSS